MAVRLAASDGVQVSAEPSSVGVGDLLSIEQVAELTTVPVNTLRYWRAQNSGVGPRSFKLGPKRVAYRRSDVEEWLQALYEAGAES